MYAQRVVPCQDRHTKSIITIEHFVLDQCQLICDTLPQFAVEQRCRIGLSAQYVSGRPGCYFQGEKLDWPGLYFFA